METKTTEEVKKKESNIGGMVTVGKGTFDSTVVPFGLFVASFCSGARNAFTRSGKNKVHPEGWANEFYKVPTGTEEQGAEVYHGRNVAKFAMSTGEWTGFAVGTPIALTYGGLKEAYRAIRTRSQKYTVTPENNNKN